MKKLLFVVTMLIGITVLLSAGDRKEKVSDIGPQNDNFFFIGSTPTVSAMAGVPGSGRYNCVEYVVGSSSNSFVVNILTGLTTFYSITMPAGVPADKNFPIDTCATVNSSMTITTVPTASSTTVKVSYKGYVGR